LRRNGRRVEGAVGAPALEDRANEALVEFLAELFENTETAVRILSGERSRTKRLEIRGCEPAADPRAAGARSLSSKLPSDGADS